MLFWCPESPRQLVAHGKYEKAEKVLLRVYPASTFEQRQAKIRSIKISIEEATSDLAKESLWKVFTRIFSTPGTGRAVVAVCIVMAISQLSGFNTLMYYAATLFAMVGFKNATAVAVTVSGTNFVFSFVNIYLVDKFGRRFLLLLGVLGMFICLMVAAIAFHWNPIDTKTLSVETDQVGWPGTLLLVTIVVYVGLFS